MKILKRIIPYIVALILGVALWILVTPYAKAHRVDPSLTGGEALFPIAAVFGVMIVRTWRKENGYYDKEDKSR